MKISPSLDEGPGMNVAAIPEDSALTGFDRVVLPNYRRLVRVAFLRQNVWRRLCELVHGNLVPRW